MKKLFLRMASLALSCIFLISQTPILAKEMINSLVNLSNSYDTSKVEILGEILEKRSDFTKHFRMNDGSIMAVTYTDKIHYKDGEEFKEIDNTLIKDENDNYKNTQNDFKVNFSKNFKNKNLISISLDNYKVSWSYIKKKYKNFETQTIPIVPDTSDTVKISEQISTEELEGLNSLGEEVIHADKTYTYGKQTQNGTTDETVVTSESIENISSTEPIIKKITQTVSESDLSAIPETEINAKSVVIENLKDNISKITDSKEQKTNINKVCAKAKYEDADSDIDLDYSISGIKLKENIVLRKKLNDNDRFDFEFKTNLTVSKDNNGNLNFKDDLDKSVFVMPKGCMWDSNGEYSSDVSYEINKITDGYIISVIPNREWLENNSRIYPITIDPSIQSSTVSGIEDTQISSLYPDTNYKDTNHISIGRGGTSNSLWSAYLRCTQLPEFSHGEIVTSSKLRLKTFSDSYAYVNSTNNKLALSKVNGSWSQDTLAWNNKPSVDSTVQDYVTTSSETMGTWHEWDITRITKEWYGSDNKNVNNGIQIHTLNPTDYSVIRFISTNNTDYTSDKPQFVVHYKEFIGEESYWSYTSHSTGYKGIGKINNYAGTLSVSDDILSYTGSRNPLSILNTYNNVNYNEQANGYVHTKNFSGGYSHSSATGLGFRLSFNKLVYPLATDDALYESGWRYVYVDGDGTQHYFKTDGTKITDEDGLNLTLTEDSGVITITDIRDNKLTFEKLYESDEAYVLKTSSDNNGNTTTFNYGVNSNTENALVDTIVDAANRTTSITYQSGSKLVAKITLSDGKEVNFNYDGNNLKEIIYPDGFKTGYVYDNQGRLSGIWTDMGVGRCVGYSYTSNDYGSSNFFKIRSVTEYSGVKFDSKYKGKNIDFQYEMNQTKIIRKINNLDVPYHESTEVWQFDYEGHVTAVLDSNGNMISNIYCTETDGRKHKIRHTNDSGKYVNNLLKNTAAQNDIGVGWVADNWLSENISENYSITRSENSETDTTLGTYCFKINHTGNDSSWPIARQKVTIPKKLYDRKFTFSGDVKTISDLSGGSGACLHIASFSGNGQQMSGDEYSGWITSTNNEWQRESVTINVPAGASEVECAFGIKESTGTAYFDCLQLEESSTPNDYNMIENSSFDVNLDGWTSNPDPSGTVVDGKLRVQGDSSSNKKVSQTIEVNKLDPIFAIRANAQGVAVAKDSSSGAKYQIECILNFSDSTSKTLEIDFNSSISDVQSVYKSIGPDTYGTGKTVTSIIISPCFNANCNTVYFDNIQVCIDDGGTTYERNEKGLVKKLTTNDNNSVTYTLNDDNEITQIIDSQGNKIDNAYSASKPHQLTTSTVETPSADIKSTLTYDTDGNITDISSQKSNGSGKKIESHIEYSDSGNYPKKAINERNKAVEFTIDENSGNVIKIKNAKNTETNYTYDTANRIKSEICGSIQNTYDYIKGLLSEITHKVTDTTSSAYKFMYDMFGNISEVQIGKRTLSKNTYDAGNGLLRQTKYGNGQTVNYDYDEKGRLIKKSFGYGKGDKFGFITYSYDSRNRLSEKYDSINNLTTKFKYDKYGRFVKSTRSDDNSTDVHYTVLGGLVDRINSKIFGTKQTIENTFGVSNTLISSKITTSDNNITSKYSYDTSGRMNALETINSDDSAGIQHEITYLDTENSDTNTTRYISAIEIKKKVADSWTSIGEKFSYTYDEVGNITNIKDLSNNSLAYYEYDELNQLIRENNIQTNKTITYTYNAGGNLTEKKIYAYTEDEITSEIIPESTINYSYEDDNWPDKLTSYIDGNNTQNIIYDAIGNPLEYRGWEFEWSRGRRLEKASNSEYNINISFKYDENGIRTQKTVNGVQTDFITSGIKVLAQKSGDNTIIWQVDGNGNAVGFNYNGTYYFYIKNAQGDIIGITDTSGNIVAKYTYDSWGKLISIKDANDVDKTVDTTFIGYINPIRYRGYYYDSETNLYYLNARYYDPEVCRFINADETLTGGYNLFEYCFNNPVNLIDKNGNAPGDLFDTMDDAAINWAHFYHLQAMASYLEYGSNILKRGSKYYYEVATIGDANSVAIPEIAESVGYIHSHHNSAKPKANIFAIAGDVAVSETRRIVGYVVTPAGDIQRYTPLGNYGEDNGGSPNLGTLTWIYYNWRLRGSNGSKWFWRKNALDKRLDILRRQYGSITGHLDYYEVWNLFLEE